MKITGHIANFLLFSKIFSFRSNIPVKGAGIASKGCKDFRFFIFFYIIKCEKRKETSARRFGNI